MNETYGVKNIHSIYYIFESTTELAMQYEIV